MLNIHLKRGNVILNKANIMRGDMALAEEEKRLIDTSHIISVVTVNRGINRYKFTI